MLINLIIAIMMIGFVTIVISFTYPEVLFNGARGLVRLISRGVMAAIKLGVAGERRIVSDLRNVEKHFFGRQPHQKSVITENLKSK